jgi:tetratricopeptide (TPR) repeat protein
MPHGARAGVAARALLLALPGFLVATGCASLPAPDPPAGTAARAELRDVPFHPQALYQCGPAALATVIGDAGIAIDPDDLISEVYVPARQGSLPAEMRAAARSRGLVAYPLAPSIDDLIAAVDAGYPVLVMQNLGLNWWPVWHYAVVIGYDLEREYMILRSETDRRRLHAIDTFQRTWARADRWAQLVVTPGDIPPVADALPWLEAVHELDDRGHTEAARPAYRAATERWPDFQPGWMARGNLAWQEGDQDEARMAFRRAVETRPERWDGWNNLAHTLAAAGCSGRAAEAARCAHALAPDQDATRNTLSRLAAGDDMGGAGCAALPACPVDRE